MSGPKLVVAAGGLGAVAAGLEHHDFYVKVGAGHNWEKAVDNSGVPAEQIAKALRSPSFNKGDARTPVLVVNKAADFARSAAAAERRKQPLYDWHRATVTRKPNGHWCDKDSICAEHLAFEVMTPDGTPTLLCCWHYLTDAPQHVGDLYREAMGPNREATAEWADEMARQFQKVRTMAEVLA